MQTKQYLGDGVVMKLEIIRKDCPTCASLEEREKLLFELKYRDDVITGLRGEVQKLNELLERCKGTNAVREKENDDLRKKVREYAGIG